MAFRTGNGNLSLAFRDPYLLLAAGTGINLVGLIPLVSLAEAAKKLVFNLEEF